MILNGIRVVDRTTDIAGPYCTKLLADAGADVVKVEPPGGDALRHHLSGALFEFLNQSKRSVSDDGGLVDRADILVANQAVDTALLWESNPALVVVTVTPFGCEGPWVDLPATEFTLQAWCGSTASRGRPETPPFAAGGRLGEWVAGTYAAVAALGALRSAAISGRGEHVDLALLDCMTVAMTTYPSVFASFSGRPAPPGTGRTIEVPSIEPTADGFVVFTTNSARQFQDFLMLIGRPDLVDDRRFATFPSRFRHRDEFLAAVHEYTTKRSSREVLETAALWRVPAGPVLNAETIMSFEQFVDRETFVATPSGNFRQPRVPYSISGISGISSIGPARPSSPPTARAAVDSVEWDRRAPAQRSEWVLPLNGVRVLDCTAWWAGPAAPHVLACLGADVIKVESAGRPDLMRYSSTKPPTEDRWWEWGPLFHAVNLGKRGITLDLAGAEGVDMFERLLKSADVVIENYTPRVMEQFGLGWDRVHEVNPAVVMVRMPAFGLSGPWRDRTGFAQTMESITGMAWLTGPAHGTPILVRGAGDPIAGIHAAFATILALNQRDRDGQGRLVESPMIEAALNAAAEQLIEYQVTGTVPRRAGNRSQWAAPQGVYQCAGLDRWVAIAIASNEQWRGLQAVLGNPGWATDPALASFAGRREDHDRIDAELTAWCLSRDAEAVTELLTRAGVPAAIVTPGPDVSGNPQLRHRRLFEVEDHPVTGRHEIPVMPFRFSRVERWATRPSPTLGEHNDEVLSEVATPAELDQLRNDDIIGDRVKHA
jgi:crotonobetainyl-CoA:carnitine CoA-transferase CaiB-like acyl-CoA transferase